MIEEGERGKIGKKGLEEEIDIVVDLVNISILQKFIENLERSLLRSGAEKHELLTVNSVLITLLGKLKLVSGKLEWEQNFNEQEGEEEFGVAARTSYH